MNVSPLEIMEHEGKFSLVLYEDTAIDDEIEAIGEEPNGDFWDDLSMYLVRTKAPDIDPHLNYDSEAGMFCVYSSDRAPLEQLGGLIAEVVNSPKAFAAMLEKAKSEGVDFSA